MKKIILLVLSALALTGCGSNKSKTLDWCFYEIRMYEGYEEALFTYQEVVPDDYKVESEYNVDCYVIHAYTDEKISEWFCFCEYGDWGHFCDCDIVWEYLVENDEDYYIEKAISKWLETQDWETEPYEIVNWTLTKCSYTPYGYGYYSLDIYYTTGEVKVKHFLFAYDYEEKSIIQIVEL